MEKLTEEQIYILKYFWEEKQDIERYCDFEKIRPDIQEKCPELLKAWNDYNLSIKNMDAIINSL